ncbi:MAG: integration host factor subunit beta [Nitrospirae bacterium]|nr:integration host factor subunit beta [Nitrospirota bacterium]
MGSFLDFAGILVKGISIAIEEAKKQEENRKDFKDVATEKYSVEPTKDDLLPREEPSKDETKNAKTAQRETIESFTDIAKKSLTENGKFTIRGFGSFTVKDHKPRKARNPRTGEPIDVPARKSIGFKMGRDLEEMANKLDKEDKEE